MRGAEEEQDATLQLIRQSGAALTFVGLGCPRQEVWVFEGQDLRYGWAGTGRNARPFSA